MIEEKIVLQISILDNIILNLVQKNDQLFLDISQISNLGYVKVGEMELSTCRTVFKHRSPQTVMKLSLPIPDPRAKCKMTPGYFSITNKSANLNMRGRKAIIVSKSTVKIRSLVKKLYNIKEDTLDR